MNPAIEEKWAAEHDSITCDYVVIGAPKGDNNLHTVLRASYKPIDMDRVVLAAHAPEMARMLIKLTRGECPCCFSVSCTPSSEVAPIRVASNGHYDGCELAELLRKIGAL